MDPVSILRPPSAIALIDFGACDILHICQGPLYSPHPAPDDRWELSPRGVERETAMRQKRVLLTALAVLATAVLFNGETGAQTTPTENAAPNPDNAVMITVFLKHDQSRPVDELNAQLDKQGYYKSFPPPGIEVVSWASDRSSRSVCRPRGSAKLTVFSRPPPGAPTAPSSIRPTTSSRPGSRSTKRRSSRGDPGNGKRSLNCKAVQAP
jgi:hypothetical protein